MNIVEHRVIPFEEDYATASFLRNGSITTTGILLSFVEYDRTIKIRAITSRKQAATGHITGPADPDYLASLIKELQHFEGLLRCVKQP